LAAELRTAQSEVEAFHRFRQLSQELLEVNERICGAHPVADTLSPEEQTKQAVRKEVPREGDQLLRVISNGRRPSGRLDLEAPETVVRSALLRGGQQG